MKLSTRSTYGLLAMYDLALNRGAPVAIKAIAKRQELSEAYLEQLFASLKKADLVVSRRGAQGGYVLSRTPAEITIGDILTALEGSVNITECVNNDECGQSCSCPSRSVFMSIQRSIDRVLYNTTLLDMVHQAQEDGVISENMAGATEEIKSCVEEVTR